MKKRRYNAMRRLLLLICCFCLVFSSLSLVACDASTETESNNNDTADKENKGEELVEVIRIIDDVKIGGKFTNDRLSVVRVSPEAVPEGAITDVAELKNKYAIAPLHPGDYITAAKISSTKPGNAVDEDEEEEVEGEIDPSKLGYVIVTEYAKYQEDGDYAPAIQKAIDENPGRTIYIPDGSYFIEQPIVIPADPAKSVSLRLGNMAVLKADAKWADPHVAMIRVGVEEPTEKPLTMDEIDMKGYRSISIIGGCIHGSNVASGISVEGGKDTYIYNVSLKSVSRAIHVLRGNNELGATWVNVDNVNVTGTDKDDSVGVLVEGTYNTFSNMRIYIVKYGIQCTETGERNIFRNLHPLASNAHQERSIGFYDMSDGNNFDVCYSDQFATGYAMHENTRTVMNGGFCYWYSDANKYHVGYKAMGKFNSIVVSGNVSHGHTVATDAYLYIEEEGGQGVVLYPKDSTVSDMHEDMLKKHCPTPIL